MSNQATSAPVSAPATATVAQPMTARDAFASLSKQPTASAPTVSTPAAKLPEPTPVEGAARDVTPELESAPEQTEVTPELEAASEQLEAEIDYRAKYQEILDSGDLHDSLLDKMVMAKIDGQEMPVSVKEALAGYQRKSDYSRHMNEIAQARQAVLAEKQQMASTWDALKGKPDLALEVFSERFGDEWLDGLVQTRQAQREEYDNSVLGAGYRAIAQLGLDPSTAAQDQRVLQAMAREKQRLDHARSLEAENKKLRRAQQQTQAQAQQQTQAQESQSYQERFNATVKRFSDAALKAEGLSANSVNRAELSKAVAQVLIARNHGVSDAKKDFTVGQDVVREAAQILKENRGTKPAQQAEPPLPARQGMGTGVGAPVAQQKKPLTSRDALAQIGGKRW